jgi:hypothetical protein
MGNEINIIAVMGNAAVLGPVHFFTSVCMMSFGACALKRVVGDHSRRE